MRWHRMLKLALCGAVLALSAAVASPRHAGADDSPLQAYKVLGLTFCIGNCFGSVCCVLVPGPIR